MKSLSLPGLNLLADAATATEANSRVCLASADRYATYRRFWGLSAGDGPGPAPTGFAYRAYSPAEPLDGTAHITATVASLAHAPAHVWENICQALAMKPSPRGRYGFSNINLDFGWIGTDMVGIDAGAAVLALDNCLEHGRVRRVFHGLPTVQTGLRQIGARRSGVWPHEAAADGTESALSRHRLRDCPGSERQP